MLGLTFRAGSRGLHRLMVAAGGGLLAATTLMSSAMPAHAYVACQTESSGSTSTTTATPGTPFTFTGTFKDCNGNPAGGQGVAFTQQSGPAGCTATFNPRTSTTDANGQASTEVTLPNCPNGCQYTLAATSGGVTVTVVVKVAGCLPFTAAAAPLPSPHAPPWPAVGLLLAVAALAAGMFLGLRRDS